MKKLVNVLLIVVLSIVLTLTFILGLAFTFIEGRFVISFDWIAYHNPINVFIRHILRLFLAVSTLIYVIFEFINIRKKKDNFTYKLLGVNIGLVILGIIMFICASNYVDIVGLIIPIVLLLVKLILIFVNKYYKQQENN